MLILLCDDEPMVRMGLKNMLSELEPNAHLFLEAANGRELMAQAASHPDIAFVDIRMPLVDGLTAIEQAKKISPGTKWIMLTGYSQFAYAQQALRMGVSDYLLKPVGMDDIAAVMKKAAEWMRTDDDGTLPQGGGQIAADMLSQVKEYINGHYMDDIGVNSIAELLDITPNYLSRIFHAQTGMKFIDYLSEARISHAKRLLRENPSMTVRDVAERVGYMSAKHFARVFYKLTGATPSDYQKSAARPGVEDDI